MRTTSTPPEKAGARAWDGSFKNYRTPRSLRVAPDSPTRLLRAAQPGRCSACGNRIEWYCRPGERTVPLHPRELPAKAVPVGQRWHVSSGLAHPSGDGSPWCRVRHHAICPVTTDATTSGLLGTLRRALAVNSRRLTDTGTFTPPPDPTHPDTPSPAAPVRPVVHLLYTRYLAPGPLEQITCVALTRARHRCPHPVLDPDALPGTWTLIPLTSHHHDGSQLPPTTEESMAVYDLTHLPYAEQFRWRAQRCTTHADTPAAADIALTAWEPFNPQTHRQHIQHQLPDTPSSHRPRQATP
ncbi:DUF6083 domain-containing protein [Streptoverticillium reticulum]|uniref:DUF6083 domain-containing protein n=1 Tax=Streptoverticillium reticulum TaxID=1433415 RepID=UPI0039BF8185